jgi:hypothetical protein
MINFKHLVHLTDNEIHNTLMVKGYRPSEVESIKSDIAKYKAGQRRERGRQQAIKNLWKIVIEQLTNEQRTVRAMLHYQNDAYPNPERREALTVYAAFLDKLKKKLRKHQKVDNRTPKEQARHEKETHNRDIPNDGAHWVDWVPPHINKAITAAFEAIPARYKGKVKTPFRRIMSKTTNADLRNMHILTVKREIAKLEQERSVIRELNKGQPSVAEREVEDTLDKYKRLLQHLFNMSRTDIVPPTWAELYSEYLTG